MVKKNCKNSLLAVAVFAALFCILFFTPYVTDDYSEKLSVMNITWPECFRYALLYGNGRFLGNLGMLSCLRSDLIRAFLKPLIITAAVFSLSYVFEIRTLFGRLVACAILIIPSQGFFSYCYIKNPCFFNYVVPVCFFTICLAVVKWSKKAGKLQWYAAFVLLILSFCMQLFSENSSIIFMLFALGLCVYNYIEYKKISACNAALLVGTAVGLAVMLFLPDYLSARYEIKYDMSEYRNMVFNIPYMIGVLSQFCEIFSSSFIIIAFLSALEIFIVVKESPDDKFKKWHIIIPLFYSTTSFMYLFTQNDERKVIASVKLIFFGLFIIFLANTAAVFLRFIKSKEDKTVLCFLIVLAMMSVGMFTVLTQHGYRTFYLSVCLVIGIAFYTFNIIRREYNVESIIEKAKPVLNISVVIACICFTAVVSCQMIQNYDVSLMREYYIAEKIEQGETEIRVPKLPNKRLCHEDFMAKFIDYMNKHYGETEYVFVDMEEWELFETYQSMQDNPITSLKYAVQNFNFNNPLK